LKEGTHAENMRDKVVRGRCHDQRGSKNSNARLSQDTVRGIRHAVRSGVTQLEAARRFGVGGTTVGHIIHGRRWADVQDAQVLVEE
jgi:hypothetical protein